MPKGMLLKLRARMGARRLHTREKISVKNEEQRLESMEKNLENVADEISDEIDKIEELKGQIPKKHEFSWIKGKLTSLLLQDFVGASFGAIIFVFTQEVWDIIARISLFSVFAILLISLVSGFSLIYLSRRRRAISVRIYHTTLMRGIEIYAVSLLASFLFIIILQVIEYNPLLLFKGSVLVAMPAVISAATADLLYY